MGSERDRRQSRGLSRWRQAAGLRRIDRPSGLSHLEHVRNADGTAVAWIGEVATGSRLTPDWQAFRPVPPWRYGGRLDCRGGDKQPACAGWTGLQACPT